MHKVPFLLFTIVSVSLVLTGCGEPHTSTGDDNTTAKETATVKAPEKTSTSKTVQSSAPSRDQFGPESFKIVYDMKGQTTGKRTLYIEDHGARVGYEEQSKTYNMPVNSQYYYDGEKGHLRDAPDADVYSSRLRIQMTEPTAFAVTAAADLETIGYSRIGDKTIAGKICEHWKNEALNYEGCRWNHIELEFLNGAGTDSILQTTTAIDLVIGERIPDHLKALSKQ